ncbi:MAG: DUF975 family protein [Acetobacter sp.]|nr:DUF975 family protein [Bacteroides sp.]MCM1341212.1 DUF975 family protein [Acetobacter sp.]MCM1433855.1 DUF975 family protein [Clostridiales bacterium]
MNNLNRPLIKKQAKALVKPELFKLFVISLIVTLLTGSGGFNINLNYNNNSFNNSSNDYYEDYEDFFDNYYDDYDDYDFDDFYNDHQEGAEDNPFNDFDPTAVSESSKIVPVDKISEFDAFEDAFENSFKNIFGTFGIFAVLGCVVAAIVSLIFAPLQVTEAGIYLTLIRRRSGDSFSLGDQLRRLFRESFNSSYIRKLGLVVLQGLVTILLTCLFIVPGLVYYYSTRFAFQLMNDNPDLSPTEALKLSRRMNKGHRSELLVLDLSLIPWLLLTAITFGIAGIYTLPYFKTINALYYENFRLRAMASGVISADELRSKTQSENNFFGGQNNYYYGNAQENQQNSYYQPQSSEQNYYNQPQQSNQPQPDYYNAPENSAEYYSPDSNNKTEEYKSVTEENGTNSDLDNDEPSDYSATFKY